MYVYCTYVIEEIRRTPRCLFISVLNEHALKTNQRLPLLECFAWLVASPKIHNYSRGNAFHMFTIRSVIFSPNMVWLAAGLFTTIQLIPFHLGWFHSLYSSCWHKCQTKQSLMKILSHYVVEPHWIETLGFSSKCKYLSAGIHYKLSDWQGRCGYNCNWWVVSIVLTLRGSSWHHGNWVSI